MKTGSGGGVGDPQERDPERVMGDIMDGYITPDMARTVYGLSEERIQAALAGPQKKAAASSAPLA
jgi:N-methylhydantoinase B/oxoprolinase/acetone carboxylase alpha subunit